MAGGSSAQALFLGVDGPPPLLCLIHPSLSPVTGPIPDQYSPFHIPQSQYITLPHIHFPTPRAESPLHTPSQGPLHLQNNITDAVIPLPSLFTAVCARLMCSCTCMCMKACACKSVQVYACVHVSLICVCACVYVHVCMHASLPACDCIHSHMHVCLPVSTCMCLCAQKTGFHLQHQTPSGRPCSLSPHPGGPKRSHLCTHWCAARSQGSLQW